jgi:hypothetical protein
LAQGARAFSGHDLRKFNRHLETVSTPGRRPGRQRLIP